MNRLDEIKTRCPFCGCRGKPTALSCHGTDCAVIFSHENREEGKACKNALTEKAKEWGLDK